jgi:hypothetical protein
VKPSKLESERVELAPRIPRLHVKSERWELTRSLHRDPANPVSASFHETKHADNRAFAIVELDHHPGAHDGLSII